MLGGLNYYGYFGSAHVDPPNNGADHTPEVAGYTNMNQYLNDPATGFSTGVARNPASATFTARNHNHTCQRTGVRTRVATSVSRLAAAQLRPRRI